MALLEVAQGRTDRPFRKLRHPDPVRERFRKAMEEGDDDTILSIMEHEVTESARINWFNSII